MPSLYIASLKAIVKNAGRMDARSFAELTLSARGATEDVRRHLLGYLRQNRPAPGTRLPTEAEILKHVNVSRSTLRRALDPLEKQGWIDRKAGAGTFVGSRVRELYDALEPPPEDADIRTIPRSLSPGVIRVAVLIFKIGDLAHDWYTPGVLQGLDDVSSASPMIVELLGDRDSDIDALTRRLELTRPDVLLCLSNRLKHAFVLRDAQRMGIHCLVSGTPLASLEIPSVAEDNRQTMSLAMQHLIERGHRRILLALPRLTEPWVFERLAAYTAAMTQMGVLPEVVWTEPDVNTSDADVLLEQIRASEATAVIPAHSAPMRMLDGFVRSGTLRVPEDVSVISFEQDHAERAYLGHERGTRIVFPLGEMGRTLAEMAQQLVRGEKLDPPARVLPGKLLEGTSVATLSPPR